MSKRSKILMFLAIFLSVVLAVLIFTNPIAVKIVNLDDKIDYISMLNKTDEIKAVKGDISYIISYEVDIAEIIKQFKKVKVNKEPILMKVTRKDEPILYSDNKLPGMTNCINIDGYFLCFNDDFTEFCGYWGPDSEYTKLYKVTNPKVAKKVFDIISTSESRRINNKLTVSNIKAGTMLDGVTVTVNQISLDVGDPYIELELKNNSDSNYEFGVKMDLYYMQGDKKESCSTFKHSKSRKRSVPAVARLLFPDGTAIQKYTFTHDDISKTGTYRFETQVAWVEFELKE